jgi:hypothetical protein
MILVNLCNTGARRVINNPPGFQRVLAKERKK